MKNVQISPDLMVGETIDGVEHPDPRMRPARLSIRIPALFWERVRRHLERCQSSPSERMLWEQWFTPEGVQALLSGSASRRGALSGSDPAVHETALRHLRATISESLQHPLSLRLDPEPAGRPGSPASDPSYLLILTNGATVVIRITNTNKPSLDETIPARLDDCFFTRAAADFARPAGDFALPAAPSPAHLSAKHPSGAVSQGRMRDAVVREWVGRYAVTMGDEDLKGLVPPDRPCDVKGSMRVGPALRTDATPLEETVRSADPTNTPCAHFLAPTAWGFSGGANGCVWVGYESSSAAEVPPNSETLRRLLAETREDGSHKPESSNRNANTSPDSRSRRRPSRYPLALSGEASRSNQSRPNSARRSVANDALVCIPELARAMEEYPWAWVQGGESYGERTSSDTSAAAYRSAIALGRCRLLGSSRAELAELALAPAVGMSAARELALRVKQWSQQAKSLPFDMRGATAPRASDLCMGILEARLEAWAAYLAIDESYSAAVDRADASTDAFSQAVDAVLDGLAAFDDAIQFAEPLVTTAAAAPGSRLLDNWKKLLAAPYRQSPPWWLDCVASHAALGEDEF
jgi:hypothetical protein